MESNVKTVAVKHGKDETCSSVGSEDLLLWLTMLCTTTVVVYFISAVAAKGHVGFTR